MQRKVLVFVQPDCPVCTEFKPVALQVAHHYKRCIETQFINVDTLSGNELSNRLRVKAVPSVIVLNEKGRSVARMVGYDSRERLVALYVKAISGGTCAVEPFTEV